MGDDYDLCPVCDQPYVERCRCELGDMRCENGHEWHHCPTCGARSVGGTDHGKPAASYCCHKCAAGPASVGVP